MYATVSVAWLCRFFSGTRRVQKPASRPVQGCSAVCCCGNSRQPPDASRRAQENHAHPACVPIMARLEATPHPPSSRVWGGTVVERRSPSNRVRPSLDDCATPQLPSRAASMEVTPSSDEARLSKRSQRSSPTPQATRRPVVPRLQHPTVFRRADESSDLVRGSLCISRAAVLLLSPARQGLFHPRSHRVLMQAQAPQIRFGHLSGVD